MLPRVCSRAASASKKVLSTSVAKPSTFKRHRIATAVYDQKRLADKATFAGLNASEEEEDALVYFFPNERLGLNYNLNIALNKTHRLTPRGDAFRNLHMRHLVMHANGKADSVKAIHYEVADEANHEVVFVQPTMNMLFTVPPGVKVISESQFRKIGRRLADHIGESPFIFVEDAAVGSHRLAEIKTRGITNSGNVAIALRHLLSAIPVGAEATKFDVEVSVFSAPDFDYPESLASFGLKSRSFTVINPDRGIVLQAGVSSATALQQAIQTITAARLLQQDIPSLGLNAHVVALGAHAGLVFDPNHVLTTPGLSSVVSGANGAVWNPYGTYRSFDGVIHSDVKAPRQRGDLVEKHAKSSASNVIQGAQSAQPLEFAHPTAVVFLVKDDSNTVPPVSRVASDVAVRYFSTGFNGAESHPFYSPVPLIGQPGQAEKLFKELADESKAAIYVVNTKNLRAEDVNKIVNAAVNGSLAKVKGVADTTLKCAVITEVAGVQSSSLDPMKSWKDKAQYSTAGKKLAENLRL